MSTTELRDKAKKLIERREAIETEIKSVTERLTKPGMPGVKGKLLDEEGFPRSDIDIPAVRADRHRLAVLYNDHKEVTNSLENLIHQLHASNNRPLLNTKGSVFSVAYSERRPALHRVLFLHYSVTENPLSSNEVSEPDLIGKPFAVVDEVRSNSPAEVDGLRIGDEVVRFGSVVSPTSMKDVALELERNIGSQLKVVVRREGSFFELAVIPRNWAGAGFLGCHFRLL